MIIRCDIILDEDQLKRRGITIETIQEELKYRLDGALNSHTNPRWPSDTNLDYEIDIKELVE
jgi:hypothetical protein